MAASKVLLKVVVLGGSGVGKTQLLRSLSKEDFVPKHTPTSVANLVPLEIKKGGKIFNLQCWDMPGDSKSMTSIQPRNLAADACVLVYSIADKTSVRALQKRLDAFNEACEKTSGHKNPKIIIVGTHGDDMGEDAVPLVKVQKWAEKKGIEEVYEVSGKTGKGVKEAFDTLMVAEEEDFLNMDSLTAGMDELNNRRRPVGKATQPCPKAEWVPDADVTNCGQCGIKFTLFVRKHHCRACGDIFCGKCSSQKWTYSAQQVRVCDECISHFNAEFAAMGTGGKIKF